MKSYRAGGHSRRRAGYGVMALGTVLMLIAGLMVVTAPAAYSATTDWCHWDATSQSYQLLEDLNNGQVNQHDGHFGDVAATNGACPTSAPTSTSTTAGNQSWITFCHATPASGPAPNGLRYNRLTTADDGSGTPSGDHQNHDNDIIPGWYNDMLGRDATAQDVEDYCGAPTLTIVKTWEGAPWANFALQVTPDGGSPIAATSGVALTLEAGSYLVEELNMPVSGYEAGDWGGDCAADGTITLADGDDATCTITNYELPTLALTKTWQGDAWADFGLTVTPDGGSPVAMTSGVAAIFQPGDYTAGEVNMPAEGYEAGDWGGDCAADGTVTLDYGDHLTCSITNYELPSLTLTKTWEGDSWDEFSMTATRDGFSPVTMTSGVAEYLQPGDYTADELGMPDEGYEAGDWGGDCAADGSVTLAYGEHKTCSITNYEVPTLTLVKTWIGDPWENFSMTVTPDGGSAVTMTSGQAQYFEPGDHTAAELGMPAEGYEASDWGGDCAADGTVTLAYGDHKTCTITNREESAPPSATITVVKTWEGEPWANFGLTLTPDGGNAQAVSSGVPVVVTPGSFTVAETGMPGSGYVAGLWGGDCATDGTITLADLDNATCTITNYELPTLTLEKTWEGEPWDDFGMTITPDGESPIAATSGVAEYVVPGLHTAAELNMPAEGYEAGDWGGDCAADGTVTLDYGDHLTCTITNYELPTLTLEKTWVGDPWPNFAMTVTPDGGSPVEMTSGVEEIFQPGLHQAAELNEPVIGYTAGAWGGDCAADGTVTLEYGEHATCTITNTEDDTGGPSTSITKPEGPCDPNDADCLANTTVPDTSGTTGGGSTIAEGPCDLNDADCLANTGAADTLIPTLLAGLGLLLLGAGVLILADERRRYALI